MLLLSRQPEQLLILIFFALKAVISSEEIISGPQPNKFQRGVLGLKGGHAGLLEQSTEDKTHSETAGFCPTDVVELTHPRLQDLSGGINSNEQNIPVDNSKLPASQFLSKPVDGSEGLARRDQGRSSQPRDFGDTRATAEENAKVGQKQARSGSEEGAGGLVRKDEGSNSSANSGWGLFSTLSGAFRQREPPRKRKAIEDIPIIGGLVSLGGAIELAGKRSADVFSDGARKFGDLARGTLTKSGFKYPITNPGSSGIASAVGGLGELSTADLTTVASAFSNSNGRSDFVKQLLEKSTPESAFRLGLAAASVSELKSNPIFAGLLKQFATKK